MESNDKFKKTDIKNRACSYLDDIIKIEDFDIHNILLINEKSYKNILDYNISYKSLIDSIILELIKQMDLPEFMMELDIQFYWEVKSMIPFSTGLDTL